MKKLSLLMALCSIFALMSCKKLQEQSIPVSSITINEPAHAISLTVTESKTFQVTIIPQNATNNKIVWSSDDATIATVSETGTVVGIKAGATKIWAKSVEDNSIKDECLVTVADKVVDITEVTLNSTTLDVEIDQTASLTVTVLPDNATNRDVIWSSSDETIATVSKTGNVTGLAIGKATITVASETDKEKFAVCEMTVTAKTIPATDMWMKTTKLELKSGQNGALSAVTIPTNATNQEMIWSSDDQIIATVDPNGVVTGLNAGTTTIWVKWGGDNSIKDKCTVTVLAESSYSVGDLYPDADNPIGIVFWKDPNDPTKGKIVSLVESKVEWSKQYTKTNALDENDGAENMKLIESIAGWETSYPAFKLCSDMGENWYLPAISEMQEIYKQKDAIASAIEGTSVANASELKLADYWTSTEKKDSQKSFAVTIQCYVGQGGGGAPSGGTGYSDKNTSCNTRAVMKF